jgi:hypothetical protein
MLNRGDLRYFTIFDPYCGLSRSNDHGCENYGSRLSAECPATENRESNMKEVSYYKIRAQHYSQLAAAADDPRLKSAFEAIAADMSSKVTTADPQREVFLIDGVAVGIFDDWPPPASADSPHPSE